MPSPTQEQFAEKAGSSVSFVPMIQQGEQTPRVETFSIEKFGADRAAVANFLNHKSPRTTKRFYATMATPAKVPTLL